ncbi:lipopolysaccharide biosynthesis protein [Pseudorhodoferax soli]|uniref:PST family polysaccharide transporter n=1 Tax=Pseudorhodoferax soli TaxID=545864 RepID=A0A368Y9M6_9BURK|nr:lipopolysaccharide biosynthesis protein [Pseudorhodoferax soli]RCW76036.1 PST family polysaccharide transporter [Pseudorhodoferax soli]
MSEPIKPGPPVDLGELRRKSVSGGLLTVGARLVSVVFSLASTAVLARLLSPEDFGVLAMVLSVTAFVAVFKDFGLSAAAVQKGSLLTALQASNLFWLNLAAGVALSVLVATAAPLAGWIFGNPALVPATMLISISFVLTSLGSQHGAMLQSRLQFKRKALADVVGALASLLVAVVLAFQGHSYWSLVWGTIAGAAATSLLLILLVTLRIQRPQRGQGVRSLLQFGGHVTAFEFVNYFHRNLDNILIGRVWGAEALGIYSRAYQLLMFPITNLRTPISAVAFSAMSRLRDEPEKFRAYYLKVSFLLALTSMPLVAFLAVAAEQVIGLLLGERWLAAVPIFQALAVTAFIQPVASLRGLVSLASGRSRDYLLLGVINAVVVCAAFVAALPWGPFGVAVGYGVAVYALLYPTLRLAFRQTGIQMGDFWRSIRLPVATSLVASCLASAIGGLAALESVSHIVMLSVQAVAFVVAWVMAIAVLPGGWKALRETGALFRQLR